MHAHSLLKRKVAIFVALLLTVGGVVGVTGMSLATHPISSLPGSDFEIDNDANLKTDDPSPSLDWDSVLQQAGNDLPSGTGDDSFTQGSQERDAIPTPEFGSIPPNKSDLTHFGIYKETKGSDHFVHMFWTRVQDPSGTTNMDFEFNRNTCTGPTDPGCSANGVTPTRSAGDILISYDLEKGGANPVLSRRTWDGSAWTTAVNLTSSGEATGSINTSAIAQADSDGVKAALDPRTFGEASVDLSIIFDATQCDSFGSVYLKSRSSDAFTSEIKDFIKPVDVHITNCGSVKIRKVDNAVPPHALNGAQFTLYENNPPAATFGVEDTITSPVKQCTTAGAGECVIDDVLSGEYFVVETVTPAHHQTASPQPVTVVTDTQAGPITFVDPRDVGTIRIVKRVFDDGGTQIAPPDLTALNGASFVVFVDANGNASFDAGEEAKLWPNGTTTAACTITNGLGYCDVGPLPTGTYGVHETAAPAGTQVGSDRFPVVLTTNGQRVNVNYDNNVHVAAYLTLDPPQDANQVGTPHVFTAHLRFDRGDGNGFVDAPAGEVVSFTKLSGPGSLGSSCTTTATGSCTVSLTSTVTGLTTVQANWRGNIVTLVGSVASSTTSADALKRWTDARLVVTPPSAANQVGDTHTFLAHLTFDRGDGSGFVDAASGEVITFTKVSGPGSLGGTCTTVSGGVCSVDLISSATGLTTVRASWSGSIATAQGSASAQTTSNDGVKRWTDARLSLTPPQGANQIGNAHTFTAHLELDSGDGRGFADAGAGYTIDFTKASGPGALAASSCTTSSSGSCSVDLTSAVTGLSTVRASWNGVISTAQGSASARTTSNDAFKRWIDATLDLTPSSATNRIGDTHTFTAHLRIDHGDGRGFVDGPSGETIDLQILSGPGTLSATDCTTSASGSCTVDLTSLVTGTTNVRASWNGSVVTAQGSAQANSQADAEKIWVDALITINPPKATNEIGDDHVFTIGVFKVDGGVTSAASGVVASAAITNGPGSFVNGNTCTTNSAGECTVTISSSHTGLTTVEASATVTVQGRPVSVSTNGVGGAQAAAVKRWVDARLNVTPPEATNIAGDTHTFTAHLEIDFGDGSGFVDASGEVISWSKLSGPGTFASAGCVTDTHGECTADLTSSITGTTDVRAAWMGVVATSEGTATLSRSDTAIKHWVKHPAIEVVKDGPVLAHELDKVTYTFAVTNTGDVPLTDVAVTDNVLGAIGSAGDLAVGQTKSLSKDFTVPLVVDGVDNIATACGDDPDAVPVCDTDPHSMLVIHPDIQLVKGVSPSSVDAGGSVTYTYRVTNVGDTALNDVLVTDDVLGDIGTIASLQPGQTVTLSRTVTIQASSPRTNVGTACGVDILNKKVCDTSTRTITIVLPLPPQVRLPKTGFRVLMWTAFGTLLVAVGLAMLRTRKELVTR